MTQTKYPIGSLVTLEKGGPGSGPRPGDSVLSSRATDAAARAAAAAGEAKNMWVSPGIHTPTADKYRALGKEHDRLAEQHYLMAVSHDPNQRIGAAGSSTATPADQRAAEAHGTAEYAHSQAASAAYRAVADPDGMEAGAVSRDASDAASKASQVASYLTDQAQNGTSVEKGGPGSGPHPGEKPWNKMTAQDHREAADAHSARSHDHAINAMVAMTPENIYMDGEASKAQVRANIRAGRIIEARENAAAHDERMAAMDHHQAADDMDGTAE